MTDQTRPNPADTAEAVEAVIAQLMGELGGSLGVLLTDLGLRAGIWPALRGTGPVSVADLAARTGVAAPLLREWLRSQAAAGYVRHHPGATGPDQDRFALPEPVAIALLDAPGGAIVGACTEMLISMAEHHDALGTAIAGDGGLGWDERDFRHWHGADRLTRASLPEKLIAAAVDAMDGIGPILAAGGTVLDVGCGFGFPTLTIAGHHPGARAIGIDYHARSVAEASSRAERAGLADRVSFQVAGPAGPRPRAARPGRTHPRFGSRPRRRGQARLSTPARRTHRPTRGRRPAGRSGGVRGGERRTRRAAPRTRRRLRAPWTRSPAGRRGGAGTQDRLGADP